MQQQPLEMQVMQQQPRHPIQVTIQMQPIQLDSHQGIATRASKKGSCHRGLLDVPKQLPE
jgi:hypothetical protein